MVRVLVIEDDAGLREDTIEVLRFSHYDAQGAPDGITGLALAQTWQPDVIVCDNMMPGMSGMAVIRALHDDPTTALIPIIMFTAFDEAALRHEARLAGVDDFISKPFQVDHLIEAIEARLTRHGVISSGGEEKLEQARTRLVRMVSHELRTPLVSVNAVLEILSRQITMLEPGETQDLLDTMAIGTRRLTHRVEQLVYINQLDTGKLSAEVVQAEGVESPIWEMLIAANNIARRFAYQMQPGVTINAHANDYDLKVLCAPFALKQALAEIVANALTFSPADALVKVRQWRRGNTVFVGVSDVGPGIAADKLDQAVQRFQQIDRDVNEQQGLGVGLWLAERILAAHGGRLDIRSQPGAGTQVIVRLPVAPSCVVGE